YHGSGGHGIIIEGPGDCVIAGDYIGADTFGSPNHGNAGDGILIQFSPHNTIGGPTAADRNLITGNRQDGIQVVNFDAAALGTVIQGNYIGTDVTGTKAAGNNIGVELNSFNDRVGGLGVGEGNVISGNAIEGIRISLFLVPTRSTGHWVQGNFI